MGIKHSSIHNWREIIRLLKEAIPEEHDPVKRRVLTHTLKLARKVLAVHLADR